MAPNSRGSWLSVIYVLLVIVFFVFTMTTMSTWAQTQENHGSFWREPFHSYNTAPSEINWRCFLRTTWNCIDRHDSEVTCGTWRQYLPSDRTNEMPLISWHYSASEVGRWSIAGAAERYSGSGWEYIALAFIICSISDSRGHRCWQLRLSFSPLK